MRQKAPPDVQRAVLAMFAMCCCRAMMTLADMKCQDSKEFVCGPHGLSSGNESPKKLIPELALQKMISDDRERHDSNKSPCSAGGTNPPDDEYPKMT